MSETPAERLAALDRRLTEVNQQADARGEPIDSAVLARVWSWLPRFAMDERPRLFSTEDGGISIEWRSGGYWGALEIGPFGNAVTGTVPEWVRSDEVMIPVGLEDES